MMIVKRRSDRVAAANIVKAAQIKKARTDSDEDFRIAAKLFTDTAKMIRARMKELGSDKYEHFHAGFEECAYLRMDPLFKKDSEVQYLFGNLQGADSWLRHASDKLGEPYVSPAHFFKAWELAGEVINS